MGIGKVVTYRKQRFERTGERPCTRKDGSEGMLQVWDSHCRRCGRAFSEAYPLSWEITASGPGRRPTRVCKEHRVRYARQAA